MYFFLFCSDGACPEPPRARGNDDVVTAKTATDQSTPVTTDTIPNMPRVALSRPASSISAFRVFRVPSKLVVKRAKM